MVILGTAVDILVLIIEKPRQTPATIQKQLKLGYSTINNCLWHLKDLMLVESEDHGVYIPTDLGKKLLEELKRCQSL